MRIENYLKLNNKPHCKFCNTPKDGFYKQVDEEGHVELTCCGKCAREIVIPALKSEDFENFQD